MADPKIDTLVDKLTTAATAYYNGTPLMSDAAYDQIEDELRALDPGNIFFSKVGAPAPSSGAWIKVKHGQPMTSLNKAQTQAEFNSWARECGLTQHGGLLTEKLDGISCFDGGTKIHLANGELVPIQEIAEKGLTPRVLTWDPQQGVTTETVAKVHDNGIRDNWIELTFEDGSIVKVTREHLFFVKGKGWVEAKDLLGEDVRAPYWIEMGNPFPSRDGGSTRLC